MGVVILTIGVGWAGTVSVQGEVNIIRLIFTQFKGLT